MQQYLEKNFTRNTLVSQKLIRHIQFDNMLYFELKYAILVYQGCANFQLDKQHDFHGTPNGTELDPTISIF